MSVPLPAKAALISFLKGAKRLLIDAITWW